MEFVVERNPFRITYMGLCYFKGMDFPLGHIFYLVLKLCEVSVMKTNMPSRHIFLF